MDRINRRNLLKGISLLGGSTLLPGTTTALHSMIKDPKEEVYTSDKPFKKKFSYCFNSSTIRGQKIGIEKEVELVAKAGYDAIEVWVPVLN